jgi:hypothetical protein
MKSKGATLIGLMIKAILVHTHTQQQQSEKIDVKQEEKENENENEEEEDMCRKQEMERRVSTIERKFLYMYT